MRAEILAFLSKEVLGFQMEVVRWQRSEVVSRCLHCRTKRKKQVDRVIQMQEEEFVAPRFAGFAMALIFLSSRTE
jgi:hypothetical protein